ncbi:uroporphyrinogen-III C-methyltransferase [Cellulomonas bogoriensis]|uniref:uroporphyrinogen-III C-methyltransferase n=1 Tax=Cellulomonas bogoriensis 69B4 = DSM 16987 TaxID=1386082 RepID=A0A0A0BUQ4_9CELL|nr:uroporphyrinogen-III C-methyltransferase [Cellulomonas bogoriensis]KGM10869.1 siroheme synthase CysG [Cellulomonas bogoriensis 69B4 = DSM 16987]
MTALLALDLTGRRVVVAGGGPTTRSTVTDLTSQGADVHLVADRPVRPEDLHGAWLVHTCTGDPTQDARVARLAADHRTWCVGDHGTARTPALTTTDDLVIGVTPTTGTDTTTADRVAHALADHLACDPVDQRHHGTRPGRVLLVGGGPGAPDLLTVRGRRALSQADVVITDRLGPTQLLADLPPDVDVIDVGKTPGNHPVPQHEINRLLVDHARAGRTVVRLKGGDPFLYGRGGEEVRACHEAGVHVEVVPGVSSALAVPAAAGIPVTHRGTSAAVHVVSGHLATSRDDADVLDEATVAVLREASATVVVLMGVGALPDLTAQAVRAGADPTTPVAIVEEGSTPRQRVHRGTLADIAARAAADGVRSPAVIVIGPVCDPALLLPQAAPAVRTVPATHPSTPMMVS